MLKPASEFVMNAKSFLSHGFENNERLFENPFLVGKTQDAEGTGQREAPALCDRSALRFIEDQKIGVSLIGKLNRFGLALVQVSHKIHIQWSLERIDCKPSGAVRDPLPDRNRCIHVRQFPDYCRRDMNFGEKLREN